MEQPELGLKILALRKQKGLTQEELVQLCNINVRTIQRIEAGEVTPRPYTVRTILDALGTDYEQIVSKSNLEKNIKHFMMLDLTDARSIKSLLTSLNMAWIFGILYFMISFIEYAADYYRFAENEFILQKAVYIGVKTFSLGFYTMFMRGYIATGTLFKNHLLRVTSFMMLFAFIISQGYDIITLYFPFDDIEFSMATKLFCFGTIGVLLGVSIVKLRKALGTIAMVTGVLEIVTGTFLISIILVILGMVFLTGAQICGIILLYQVVELVKKKQGTLNEVRI